MSCLTAQTLQYGVTRAQESEAVNSDMICEETCKIGFFCASVAFEHDLALVDRFQPANRMTLCMPPFGRAALLFRAYEAGCTTWSAARPFEPKANTPGKRNRSP